MNNMKIRLLSALLIAFFSTSLMASEAKISSNPYLQNYETNYFASQTEVANQVSRQIAALEAMEAATSNSMANKKDNTNIGYTVSNNAASSQNTASTSAPLTSNMQKPNQTTTTDNTNPWSKPNPWTDNAKTNSWTNTSPAAQNNQNIALPPPPNIFSAPTAKAPIPNNQSANNSNAGTVTPTTKPDSTK